MSANFPRRFTALHLLRAKHFGRYNLTPLPPQLRLPLGLRLLQEANLQASREEPMASVQLEAIAILAASCLS